MAEQLSNSVEFGLRLSKRIYYGKDGSLSAPKPSVMEKSDTCLPTAPTVYAEISEPAIVDNPDISSYQPYVHGRCDPPALIPLHMHGIEMEVDCYLDTAFVTMSGTWRVHCVTASKICECRIAVPMGEQGSVLGVEVQTTRRSYYTQLITIGDTRDAENAGSGKDGCLLKRQIYTLKVSQVDGGSNLFVKVRWSQKLLYQDGQFCLCIPFSFPAHVIPVLKSINKREKILLNLNAGTGTQVLCKTTSHPLKELRRHAGELGFSYEAEVLSWSTRDFFFSFSVCSSDISGRLLLQSPSLHDVDQREMFCLYLFPGSDNSRKAIELLPETGDSVPLIFLITDGAVENERDICHFMKNRLANGELSCPRICTFGIGSYCNHYFLQMLAQIGRGYHDAAYDTDSIIFRMQRLFDNTSSVILANITLDVLEHLVKLELHPFHIPDLTTGSPLIISGRYHGKFPDSVKASGILADLRSFVVDVKVQKAKDFPLDMVLARRRIDALTSHAWLSGSKQLEEKVVKMSIKTGIPSEYTGMILVQTDKGKRASGPVLVQEMIGLNGRKIIFLGNLGAGFGSLTATGENLPPGMGEPKLHESKDFIMKAASNYCGRLVKHCCCCLCCIRACSQLNDRCAVAFTQLCTALACFECLNCCCELCDSCI